VNLDLDWPVGRAGVAVVSPSGEERASVGGVRGDDEFAVASVTKLMTAMAALAAIEGGRLGLDQPVPETGDGVTIRHLLAHAAGLPFEPAGGRRPPGRRRIYSNMGFRVLAEAVAEQFLARYGVVFRDLMARESLVLPWREILWALRRMEARGTARGGRFVTGFVGEQYALPEAVELLRRTRRRERTGEMVRVAAVDPLNLVGILTPGPRVPAQRGNLVVYRDGLPIAESAGHLGTAHRVS